MVVMSSAPWAAPRLTHSCGGLAGEEAVGETAGEAVAAADAVFDFQVVEVAGRRRICHRAHMMADQSLIVAVFTPRSVVPTTLMLGIIFDDLLDHFLEGGGVERAGFRCRRLRLR